MASSTHGPGTLLRGVGQYSDAVFRFTDEGKSTSRSASTSTAPRDSPRPQPQPRPPAAVVQTSTPASVSTPTSAGPFTCQPNARLTPFPFPSPFPRTNTGHGLLSGSQIHPSDLEATQGLIRLSSSVEPISISRGSHRLSPSPSHSYPYTNSHQPSHSLPPHPSHPSPSQPSHPSPSQPSHPFPWPEPAPPGNGNGNNSSLSHAPVAAALAVHKHIPKHESNGSPLLVADLPSHPSISSEENAGRQSDVFSVGENSDTISDPDVDAPDRNVPAQLPRPPFTLESSPSRSRGVTPSTAQSAPPQSVVTGTNGMPSPPKYLPFGANEESTNQLASNHALEDNYTPTSQIPSRKLYDPSAPILPVHGIQCICRAVPDVFLRILDAREGKAADVNTLAKLYGACKNDLCPLHLDAFARLITTAVNTTQAPPAMVPVEQIEQQHPGNFADNEPVTTGSGTMWRAAAYRRRATSTPGIYEYELDLPSKRPRLAEKHTPSLKGDSPLPGSRHSGRPQLDLCFDERFRLQVLGELTHGFTELKEDEWSRGETTNRYIHAILSRCRHPNTDPRKGAVDAGFLSGHEAADAIERGTERIPIFTDGQQPFQWKSDSRPIVQLFNRMEDLTREVSVQIPSHNFDLPSYQNKSLAEIQERFFAESPSPDPWNILDLRNPLPPMVLPSFLTGENCQLLPRIRDSLLEGHTAERTKANRDDWNEWTDLLEWVLMSEGGHNTAPHMDSHGWSTWITIQEGNFGFGWLSRPTDKERDDWMANPLEYTGGNWRFAILKPGQTVFFPSGTIHFVFRLHDKQTLALGGHLLQWTALERWVEVILWQLKNPNITNEDLGKSPLKYIRIARKLVDHRMATSRIQTMGGMNAVTTFMVLATEVERWYARKLKKRLR